MKYPNAKIMQFAKTPEAGKVKTRMIPALGAQGALELHKQLVKKVFFTLSAARLCPVELWVSGAVDDSFFTELLPAGVNTRIRLQEGADLGQRMADALEVTLAGCEYAIIVGSDCPALSENYLAQAIQAMVDGAEVVIGPAEDGGYVLVGMRRFYPEIFEGIDWGKAEVFRQTRERLEGLDCSWVTLPLLWDVDRPEDLDRLKRNNDLLSH